MLHVRHQCKSRPKQERKQSPKDFEFFFKQKYLRPHYLTLCRLSFEEYYNLLLVNHIPVHAQRINRNYKEIDLQRRKRVVTQGEADTRSIASVLKPKKARLFSRKHVSNRTSTQQSSQLPPKIIYPKMLAVSTNHISVVLPPASSHKITTCTQKSFQKSVFARKPPSPERPVFRRRQRSLLCGWQDNSDQPF